jgi:hypothetical protein
MKVIRSTVNLESSILGLFRNVPGDGAHHQSGERIDVGAQRAYAIFDAV